MNTQQTDLSAATQAALKEMSQPRDIEGGWRSVTELLDSPKIVLFKKTHPQLMEQTMTAHDLAPALWGKALHAYMEAQAPDHQAAEIRHVVEFAGRKISLQPDNVDYVKGELTDYKFSMAWTAIFGLKDEWIWQLNSYRYLLALIKPECPIRKLRLELHIRDWDGNAMVRDERYPRQRIQAFDIPVLENEAIENFLKGRIDLHAQAESGKAYDCSPSERWERPGEWIVKKPGAQRATKIGFLSQEDALAFALDKGNGLKAEFRPGISVRCEGSQNIAPCPFRSVCIQYQQSHQ